MLTGVALPTPAVWVRRVLSGSAGDGVEEVGGSVGETVGVVLVPGGAVAGQGVGPTTLSCGPLRAPCTQWVSTCI